jgi:hypothetical protein
MGKSHLVVVSHFAFNIYLYVLNIKLSLPLLIYLSIRVISPIFIKRLLFLNIESTTTLEYYNILNYYRI